jgi:hypothetical protein
MYRGRTGGMISVTLANVSPFPEFRYRIQPENGHGGAFRAYCNPEQK